MLKTRSFLPTRGRFAVVSSAILVAALALGGCTGEAVVADLADSGIDATPQCQTPLVVCGQTCIDTQTSALNCGTCGTACPNFMLCVAGTCQLTCPAGSSPCNGLCVNLPTDNANCGACGHACPAGQVCSSNACAATCAAGYATCGAGDAGVSPDGGSAFYCANTTIDRANCGSCGNACPAGNLCSNGMCQLTCATGQTNCSGTCASLQTDNNNCGSCGNACPSGNVCSAGVCSVSCSTGLSICADTCVNFQTDNANCGACGTACPAGQVCSAGTCATTCALPLATCTASTGAYCANTSVDPANCGMCGTVCNLANTATDGCTDGACNVVMCSPGFGDCDGMESNGCETDTTASLSNCGACGRACTLPNAASSCTVGVCAVVTCNAGFADCDMLPGNGCEVNTATNNTNCGACGTVCAAGQMCSAGTCGTTCGSPLSTCSSGSAAYCANESIDPANCGACGMVCNLANAAVNACTGGTCAIASCTAGFADCDHLASTGCEASLNTDSANCGACGRACILPNAASTCTSGACSVSTCTTGFANCNGSAADGCEVNTQTDNANCGACGTACGAGQVCSRGACTATCATPLSTCGTAPSQYCTNESIDPANCGACAAACALPNTAANGCSSGACTVVRCNTSFGDCDHVEGNGCETNLATSLTNCGACGTVCTLANATASCASSTCQVLACTTGYADCDHVAANGCEVNTRTDGLNCGACGSACGAGQVCSAGSCTASCASPQTICGTAPSQYCTNTADDPANCGGCGAVCAFTNAVSTGCNLSTCFIIACATNTADCDHLTADGCEINTQTDSNNCGGCGVVCGGGQSCVRGVCACPTTDTLCSGTCVDTQTNASDCGACGHGCVLTNASSTCTAGACAITTCGTGYADCNHTASDGCEINTQTDGSNCGACGTVCAAGNVCSRGTCTTTCAAPLSTCGTAPAQYCANTTIDPSNCGSCAHVCALANVATDGCSASACTVGACATNFGNCNALATDGCETNLLTSATSCGACGRACVLANATSSCTGGACGIVACTTGFADCNHSAPDGCEASLRTDNANCGACGTTCPAGQVCSAGACTTTCASPLTSCGSGSAAYCANTAVDPSNCGSCSHVCALANVSTDGCASSACTVGMCTTGYGDCNAIATDGCETNLTSSTANCGTCGHACSLPNATSSCVSSACTLTACSAGYLNCDGSAADGCEVNGNTDNSNCGSCGHGCTAGLVCSSGTCVASCASPLVACSGACVNESNDPTHCGSCSTVCPAEANATQVCAASTCSFVCSAGFADCNRVASDGCEINTNTNLSDCGSCGNVCPVAANATLNCTAGTCGFTCLAGFANCDGIASNGCETDLATSSTNCGTCGTACAGGGACTAGACGERCVTSAFSVLVYGPSDNTSFETASWPTGTVVTIASAALWNSYTTANFGAYDVIWIDGGDCGGTMSSMFGTAQGNVATWGPAVRGRIVIEAGDPDYHGGTGAEQFYSNALTWIGAEGSNAAGGRTGLFFSWGCTEVNTPYTAGAAGSPEDFASVLGAGITGNASNYCAEDTTTAGASSPILAGVIADGYWGCPSHGGFSTVPSGYSVLATGNGTLATIASRDSPVACIP